MSIVRFLLQSINLSGHAFDARISFDAVNEVLFDGLIVVHEKMWDVDVDVDADTSSFFPNGPPPSFFVAIMHAGRTVARPIYTVQCLQLCEKKLSEAEFSCFRHLIMSQKLSEAEFFCFRYLLYFDMLIHVQI